MRRTRGRWIDLVAGYGARVDVHYLEPRLSDIVQRNEQRRPGVPRRVLDRLVRKLEPPSRTEGHFVELIEG